MKKIVYVYGNLPAYRSDFFAQLNVKLKSDDVEMVVMHGTLTGKKVVKQDSSNDFKKRMFQSRSLNIGPFSFITIKGLFKQLKKEKPDAVVISFASTHLTLLKVVLYCILHRIPYSSWRCGYNRDDYSKLSARIREAIISFVEKHAKNYISYGSYYKNILVNKGVFPENIIIAQNTIDIESIIKRNSDLIRTYSDKETKVLFVGALIKRKELHTSIEAISQLLSEGYDISFDIVGGGEMVKPLREMVLKLHLEGKIRVVGAKYGEDVRHYFRSHDIFLVAGIGGLAVNEAMAYGLPIISTNADWTICDLIDGNGYYMDKYGDVRMQVECLKAFMDLSAEEKVKMSNRSKEIISQKASLDNMTNKHKEVCMSMLNFK